MITRMSAGMPEGQARYYQITEAATSVKPKRPHDFLIYSNYISLLLLSGILPLPSRAVSAIDHR
jgi:hypothetical protein